MIDDSHCKEFINDYIKSYEQDMKDGFEVINCVYFNDCIHTKQAYNKAIDDAIDKISCGGKYNMSLVDELRKLKGGEKNEID